MPNRASNALTNDVHVFDNVLDPVSHAGTWDFLNTPGWQHGAYSDDHPDAPRYAYKHFAGYSASAAEQRTPETILEELRLNCAPFHRLWCGLVESYMPGQRLGRCYANLMAPGIGGGLHRDSDNPHHLTVIYYPNLTWSPRDAGETLFYDDAEREVVKAVAPHPNRLVVFRGTMPHVARPISPLAGIDRVTLMFKTVGRLA